MSLFSEIKDLSNEAENMQPVNADDLYTDNSQSSFEKLMKFWSFIRLALKITKFFVGNAADKVIDEVIKYGDMLSVEPQK